MPYLNDMLEEAQRLALEKKRLAEVNADIPATQGASPESAGIESRYCFDVDAIVEAVRSEIVGQDEAVKSLERVLRIVRADISDPRRPLHTALLLGPTGVGKTEMVRALARSLHGDADAFCRVDMNTLSQEHYAAALTGAPPGYVGSKEGNTVLDQAVIEGSVHKPGIVLFDEVEKASDEVIEALLNVFDNGRLVVASGQRTYSFRNTLIFMTSNLGARDLQAYEERSGRVPYRWFRDHRGRQPAQVLRMVEKQLLKRFSHEFVNRIDTVTVFNWLGSDVVRKLVSLELDRLNRRLLRHRVRLRLREPVRERVARTGYDRKFGARALRRAMRHEVEAPLAYYLLTKHQAVADRGGITTIEGYLSDGEVRFRLASAA